MTKIFVYGTLKKGYHNHYLLSEAEFLQEKVLSGFKLYYAYGKNSFPVAMLSNDGQSIVGEVYKISENDKNTIINLDRLEANGLAYQRILVDDIWLYVGISKFWDVDSLFECPKQNNIYIWNR